MALLVLARAAVARGEEQPDVVLPEVVVTAPRARDAVPAPRDPTAFATVIGTRDAATTVETVAEALSDTVGVQVRRFGGLGDFSTVSIRGFSPGQVQVYLDGVPLTRADNEVVNLSDLPLDAIDHVEVYRSTTPLAFAQAGPGGVVNVVTRRAEQEPFVGAGVSYGSFDTRKATLGASGASGPWSGLVFAQYLGSEGDFDFIDMRGTATTSDDLERTRINNAFNQGGLTARAAYATGPYTLALTTDSFVKSQGVPGRVAPQSPTAHRDLLRQLAQLDLEIVPDRLPVRAEVAAYGLLQEQSFDAPGDRAFVPTDVTDSSVTGGGRLLVRGSLGRHHLPGLLVASSLERFVQDDAIGRAGVLAPGESPVRQRTRVTVAAEDEILLLGDRVSVVPGVRWEGFHDDFPGDDRVLVPVLRVSGSQSRDFLLPRVGVRADAGYGVTLLGNASKSARMPNLTELFGNSGFVRGDPTLQPETARTWDVGFRWQSPWTSRVVTAATLEYAHFASDVDDLIALVPSSVNVFKPTNIGGASIRGDEVAVRLAFWDRLLLTTNYTHQDTRDESDEPFFQGLQLPGRPADEASVRLELGWSGARPLPGLAWLWPGRVYYDVNLIADNFLDRANIERVSSRALHGVGIDVTVPWGPLRCAWELKNFTDDQTADALGFPLPGRAMFFTVSYGLGAAP